jgi:hypothetical protein
MSGLNTTETQALQEAQAYIEKAIAALRRALAPVIDDENPGLSGKTITLDADDANWLVSDLVGAKSKVNMVKQMKGYYPQ